MVLIMASLEVDSEHCFSEFKGSHTVEHCVTTLWGSYITTRY